MSVVGIPSDYEWQTVSIYRKMSDLALNSAAQFF